MADYLEKYSNKERGASTGHANKEIWKGAYEPQLMVLLRAGHDADALEGPVKRAAASAIGSGPLTQRMPHRNALWVALAAHADVFNLVGASRD